MRIGELIEVRKGKKPELVVTESRVGYRRLIQIDDLRHRASPKYCPATRDEVTARETDVVIAWDGANAGTSSFGLSGVIGSTLAVLRPTCADICTPYLGHFIRAREAYLRSHCKGATVPHIDGKALDCLDLLLPSETEQRRIAAILDKVDDLRAKRRAALAQLDALTQSIVRDFVNDAAIKPKGWKDARLGDVAHVQGGLQLSAARKTLPIEVPYLRVANVYRGFLDLTTIKTLRATESEIARTLLQRDDLLIVEGHGNPSEIGRAALWDGSVDRCVHQNHLIRVRLDAAQMEPRFVCEFLNSARGSRHLLRAGKTTSGLNTINVSEVRATPIPKPPMRQQQELSSDIQF